MRSTYARNRGRAATAWLAFGLIGMGLGLEAVWAQAPGPSPVGVAEVGGPAMPGAPVANSGGIPADVQIVRFQGPAGVKVDVLGPMPEPVPVGDNHGLATYGFKVGVGYQLRLSNLPGREGVELFPVVEVLGHLHRPANVDPARYPLRIQFSEADFEDVARAGRLVTQVVYLENPDAALPVHLPKDEIPVVTLSPAEDPMKVALALGRPMALVRIGSRTPTGRDLLGGPVVPLPATPCPFSSMLGGRCPLPSGPCAGTPPPPGRPWLPRDEFLCDGGDHGPAAAFAGDGALAGIDPRDAVIQFNDARRPRILPTNLVCIYAPRFAAVRSGVGPNQALAINVLAGNETLARQETSASKQTSKKFTKNETAVLNRHRSRASEAESKTYAGIYSELRVLAGMDTFDHIRGYVDVKGPDVEQKTLSPHAAQMDIKLEGLNVPTSATVSGVVEGAGEQRMAWKPQELAGVELPPDRPGLAVIKRVSAGEAEPGDEVEFTIIFRNMGNVPILSVSVVDSLLPRLEYVAGSAQGPKGTVFTAAPNLAGSTELRWDLPGSVAPGMQGTVSFEARVR